jgi:hypothetical protein
VSELFPKAPRRMKQPAKAVLYDHLRVAAEELERTHAENETLRAENARLRRPWWRRILRSAA